MYGKYEDAKKTFEIEKSRYGKFDICATKILVHMLKSF